MAPERSSRPGGTGLPGMRNSALATAALTSVALLSQTADAAPLTGDEGPSREDVRQRVSSLYDRAEDDTGQHNLTRVQQAAKRGRVTPAGRARRSDPDLDNVTRQWFDGARASLGPTVPAVLPSDRTPARPAETRRARPAEWAGDARAGRELEAAPRPVPELPAAGARRPVAELTAGPTAALPAVPAPRQEAAVAALPAAAPESKQSSLRKSKQENQRKIAAASELLYRYTAQQTSLPRPALDSWQTAAQQSAPLAAIEQPQPAWATTAQQAVVQAQPPQGGWQDPVAQEQARRAADEAWRLQQPSVLDTGVPMAEQWRPQGQTVLDTGVPMTQEWRPQEQTVLDTGIPMTQDWRSQQPSVLDTGIPAAQEWRPQDLTVLDTGVPAPQTPIGTKADRAVAFAQAQIGRPCLWGAVGPESYDNAGLTQAAWKAAGVALPRSTSEQASIGTVIPLAESRPGDLIFFHDNFSHVGLYTGNGMMIHAPGPGSVIREESIHNAGEAAIRIAVRPA
ncbi:NlpC/P60 family protein [Streptomyces sp. NPDC001663]|uniref:C40 family peptidase n=1 Tax=Streptomyces sp. NPDC001663 TaxID=3364597 RepID=UPI0036C6D236